MNTRSIRNILVPVDFSKHSLKALEYAIKIAEKVNAIIYIVHAYRLIKPEALDNQTRGSILKKELEASLKLKFIDLEFQYLVSHPIEYKLDLEVGFATDIIHNMISDRQIDLVVMGTRGKREREEIFGSTTWSIIKSTSRPVLAVPKEASLNPIKNIILANENQHIEYLNFMYIVKEIAYSFQTDILIYKEFIKNNVVKQKKEDEPLYKDIFKDLNVDTVFCSHEEFVNKVKKQRGKDESDLLVLMPKENIFMESFLKRARLKEVVVDAKMPLLMIQKPLVKET